MPPAFLFVTCQDYSIVIVTGESTEYLMKYFFNRIKTKFCLNFLRSITEIDNFKKYCYLFEYINIIDGLLSSLNPTTFANLTVSYGLAATSINSSSLHKYLMSAGIPSFWVKFSNLYETVFIRIFYMVFNIK